MIRVAHLTKYYGNFLAVDDISFDISPGHVYGFLGPNGAGKSTTMNILTGCLSPTEGTVTIDGHDIFEDPNAAKACIGYLPEHPPLYLQESPEEYLRFIGQAKGLRGEALWEQIGDVMEKTGISHVAHRRISTLSKGYKQRVGIAQALLGNPKVIILDEPTVGLDPLQIIEIRELITQLGQTHTVIFSSHILSEVQAICDQILMIAGGKLVAFGTPEQLQKEFAASEVLITTDADETQLRQLLDGTAQLTRVYRQEPYTVAHLQAEGDAIHQLSGAVFKTFAASPYLLLEMALKRGTLEDVFIELSDGASLNQPEKEADDNAGDPEA